MINTKSSVVKGKEKGGFSFLSVVNKARSTTVLRSKTGMCEEVDNKDENKTPEMKDEENKEPPDQIGN